ncbi:hypothetical protein [Halomarina litorea]|uniref:hypothetical protein n=1 Tax=Halomarina litorea TaxID=2961595 RepID=UPI0020C33B4F|nr:hypothetical protein [Halomarina sp. BCD28]
MCAVILVIPLVTVRTVVVLSFPVMSVFGFGLAVLVLGMFGFRGGLIRRSMRFVLRGVGLLLG